MKKYRDVSLSPRERAEGLLGKTGWDEKMGQFVSCRNEEGLKHFTVKGYTTGIVCGRKFCISMLNQGWSQYLD